MEAIRGEGGEFKKSGRKRNEEGGEVQKKEVVEEVQGVHQKSFYDESEERQQGEGKHKK